MLSKLSYLIALVVLANFVENASDEFWKNDKIVKKWQQLIPSNHLASGPEHLPPPPPPPHEHHEPAYPAPPPPPPPEPVHSEHHTLSFHPSQNVHPPHKLPPAGASYHHQPPPPPPPPPAYHHHHHAPPPPPPPPPPPHPYPQPHPPHHHEPAPVVPHHPYGHPQPQPHPHPHPHPVPVPVHGPYPIQQPTITNTGETIIETLVGGIPFDCRGRPSGHWRDGRYCDVFHACVFGMQRKTYACPFVGERTYFDEISRRCEFVQRNPSGCAGTVFYH